MYYMAFDIRAGAREFHSPVYDFPGDDMVDDETYRRAIFDGYVSSVSTAYGAARGCGLEVDAETFERWKRCGSAAGLLDDFLDESPNLQEANELYQFGLNYVTEHQKDAQAPEWLDSRLASAIVLLRNSVSVLPERQQSALVSSARAIGSIAIKKAQCSDINEYIDCLREEGRYTAVLVSESVSENMRHDDAFPAFMNWCENALEFATLVDSARDLWADKAAGRVDVDATARNSLRIVSKMRRSSKALYRTHIARKASLAGLAARIRFSKLPTNRTMERHRLEVPAKI
jgi:hypothetical protein